MGQGGEHDRGLTPRWDVLAHASHTVQTYRKLRA